MPAFDKTWQRLFKEIVIWRRLSHPGILPALGVSPRLFPTYVIIEWMINGNIMEFTLVHPEVNRLRLVRPISVFPPNSPILKHPAACRSSQRIAVSSFYKHHPQVSQVC